MRKIETLLVGIILMSIIVVKGGEFWYHENSDNYLRKYNYPTTKYGVFLAAQHAIYRNDFENASKFSSQLEDINYPIVQSTKYISDFLSGKLPENIDILEEEKATASRLIYDAYLVSQENWKELYNRHKKDESALASPLRIWSSVAVGKEKDALNFIKDLPTNDSWKNFVSGQIYAEMAEPEKASEFFEKVRPDFMNINDYLYIMSFYKNYDMPEKADVLKEEFTSRPGGMFMLDFEDIPEWSIYSGKRNALAFSLIQNVSHTQIMMYSDLSILLLRFADIIRTDKTINNDAINYYIGQYFFNTNGDYENYFQKINKESPFYLFSILRMTEKTNDIKKLSHALKEYPLFVPAVNKLVAYYIKNNKKRKALYVINTALKEENLSETGKAFFLKSRAQINYVFGDLKSAQADLREASEVLNLDSEILSLQAKIWAKQNREIENAYEYAMLLVKQNPTDIMAWDTLGYVVHKREGSQAALELLARVGEVSSTCSSLFEQLGDLYAETGQEKLAREAYLKAIDLSDDGLTILPKLKKKLREIK